MQNYLQIQIFRFLPDNPNNNFHFFILNAFLKDVFPQRTAKMAYLLLSFPFLSPLPLLFLWQEADGALLRNLECQIQSQFLQDDISSTRERHKKVSGAK